MFSGFPIWFRRCVAMLEGIPTYGSVCNISNYELGLSFERTIRLNAPPQYLEIAVVSSRLNLRFWRNQCGNALRRLA